MIPATSLIPIHDENPTRKFSLVTLCIIIANVVVFLMEPALGLGVSPEVVEFFYRWGLVPKEITSGAPVALEGCEGPCLPDKNVYLALISSMFLHGGPIHLIGNMLFMWVFGNNVEDTVGKIQFILFYAATGVAAGLAHVAANPDSIIPTVGASGAVSGMLGAYIILFPRAHVTTIVPAFFLWTMRLPAIVVLGIWFASQFFIGASQQLGGAGVAWVAHVGGFIAGAVLIIVIGGRRRLRRRGSHILYEPEEYEY